MINLNKSLLIVDRYKYALVRYFHVCLSNLRRTEPPLLYFSLSYHGEKIQRRESLVLSLFPILSTFIDTMMYNVKFQSERISYEEFKEWLLAHPDATTVTRWLLAEPCHVSLSNDLETPTFYQTLAGVTHCKLSVPLYPSFYTLIMLL